MAHFKLLLLLSIWFSSKITYTTDFYGGLKKNTKKLQTNLVSHFSYGYEHLISPDSILPTRVFAKVSSTKEDVWIRANKAYVHLDGAFFSTNDDKNIWYAQIGLNKKFEKVTDMTGEDTAKSAFKYRDIANYNLYFWTGATHEYTKKDPYIYAEKQVTYSCYRVAMNNLLQVEVWNKQRMSTDLILLLENKYKDKKQQDDKRKYYTFDMEDDRLETPEPSLFDEGAQVGSEIFKQIEGLLEMQKVEVSDIHDKELGADDRSFLLRGGKPEEVKHNLDPSVKVVTHDKFTSTAMLYAYEFGMDAVSTKDDKQLNDKVIGYLIRIDIWFKGNQGWEDNYDNMWAHFVAVKYFKGLGWYSFDGGSSKVKIPLGPYKTFKEAYQPIYDTWNDPPTKEKQWKNGKHVIRAHRLYQCTKIEDETIANEMNVHYYNKYNNHHEWNIYDYIVSITVLIQGIFFIALVFGCCCVFGVIFGYLLYPKLSKTKPFGNKKDDETSNTVL